MSQRQRMIASVDALTGRDDCTEAVIAQERPGSPWLAVGVAGLVAIGLASLLSTVSDLPAWLLFGVAGGVAATSSMARTTYWIVARCGDDVVLARSSKWSARAVALVATSPAPMPVVLDQGGFARKATVFGRRLFVAPQFAKRFAAIVG